MQSNIDYENFALEWNKKNNVQKKIYLMEHKHIFEQHMKTYHQLEQHGQNPTRMSIPYMSDI